MRGALAALALATLFALSACTGRSAPDGPLRDSLAGAPGSGTTFSIATRTPYDFPELAAGSGAEARIAGRLVLPGGDGPVRGAAILSHGAGGLGARQERMAEHLAEQGIAALVLDHFGPRGVGSTVRDQLRAPEQAMVGDVYAARALLASHPRIPSDRIGMIGWSKGGTTAVLASIGRVAEYAGTAEPLAFAVAFYPFCGFALGEEALANPLLMLLGEADDWTPAAPCAALASAWEAAGEPAAHVVYADAPHGFDSGLLFEARVGRAISVRRTGEGCTLALDEDGSTVTLDGTHRLSDVAGREAFLADCGERGVTFGGDSAARRASFAAVDAFLADLLP